MLPDYGFWDPEEYVWKNGVDDVDETTRELTL